MAGAVRERSRSVLARTRSWLPFRVLNRFAVINGQSRTIIMASQAFTALVPLLLVIATINEQPDGNSQFAERLIRRFRLQGEAATALRTLFSRPPEATDGVGILGMLLLLFSLLALAKLLQTTFEAAWGVKPRSSVRTLYRSAGTVLLVVELGTLTALAAVHRHIPGGSATVWLLQAAESLIAWMILQYLLLSRQVRWRLLVPGALLGGAAQLAIGAYSVVSMPNLIAANSARYGLIGVSLALITWFLVVSAVIVVIAVAGAELVGQPPPSRGESL